MRHLYFYLFGFAALVAACQPVTQKTVNSQAAPTITIAPEGQTDIDLVVSTVTKAADNEAGTDSGLGTDNSTKDTEIAAIPATPPVQPTPVQPSASSATISPQSDDRISINHIGSRSWHCEYDPAGRAD